MRHLLEMLSAGWGQRLGWMLLHSVWQLSAVAGLLAIALASLRHRSPQLRYAIACAGMLLMVLLPVGTALCVRPSALPATASRARGADGGAAHAGPTSVGADQGSVGSGDQAPGAVQGPRSAHLHSRGQRKPEGWMARAADALAPWLPAAVGTWLAGVATLGLWHIGGWTILRRIRRSATRAGQESARRLADLLKRMNIKRAVQLLESACVESPITVGWLRPAILAPAAMLTGLSAEQLDAILAHELAHIRRHDYLVNLLQTTAETLLFYHPAVWWVSRRIRIERELCCDDAAVAICGNPTAYARALLSLEESRAAGQFAMAATGPAAGGGMIERIRRILGAPTARPGGSRIWAGGILAGVVLAAVLGGGAAGKLAQAAEFDAVARPTRAYGPDYAGFIKSLDLDNPAEVARLIRPAIVANTRQAADMPIGASRVGGEPDLPPDIAWPTWKDRHLVFVAQVKLDDLPAMPGREDLPDGGRLYFFYAMGDDLPSGYPDEEGAARVFYSDAPAGALVRQPCPDDVADERLDPLLIDYSVVNTMPDFEHPAWLRVLGDDQSVDEMMDAMEKAGLDGGHDPLQLLGYPMPMQSSLGVSIEYDRNPKADTRAADFLNRAENWELLFQGVDLFGECSIYFLIRSEDLKQHRWDRCWFQMQAT